MKGISLHVALLLSLLLSGNPAYGQDSSRAGPKRPRTADDYKPRTLKELAATGPDASSLGNKEETMIVHAMTLPSRARVTYSDRARTLPEIKKEVLRQWARLYAGFPEGYTGPYVTEVLFSEDGVEYWLAVRKESREEFARGMRAGDEVDLYVIRVGAAKISDRWETVVLVESFQRVK